MCQVTIYVIGMYVYIYYIIPCIHDEVLGMYYIGNVTDETTRKCTELPDGRIGVIDLTVDHDTFTMIDTDKYLYDIIDTGQILYVTPELQEKDITCYVNINWVQIGNKLVLSTNITDDNDNNDMIGWKAMIIMCVVTICFSHGEDIFLCCCL